MANRSCGSRRQSVRTVSARQCTPVTGFSEPSVRRWPHPVNGTQPAQSDDPDLHYIRCALSYQNQLLSDIKALLEKLAGNASAVEK